jgi:MoxR-like ATPase
MSESWLVGRVLADGRYVETPFVTAWRDGGLFLLDEFGACPDDVAIVANAAISNGILVIPSTGERIARNARNFIVAADNSWGRVYSAEYSARSVRDLATSNRFATSQFSIGYDASMERKLARDILGKDRIDAADAIVDCMLALRRGALAAAIERWAVSTRQIVNAAKHVAADAATLREVVERMILPLADDEIERLWAESGPEAKPWETAEPSAEPSAEPIA